MTERATLEALLARVLEGTGPDRELDSDIARELFENFGVPDDLPPYTKHRDIIVWCIKRRMEALGE
jgi:hypothetical protein